MQRRFLTRVPKFLAAILAIAAGLAGDGGRARAQTDRDNEVRAAMIFNFARFTRWPETAFSTSPGRLTICAPDGEPLSAALKRIEGKQIRRKKIVVKKTFGPRFDVGHCHVVVITAPLDEAASPPETGAALIISTEERIAPDIASIELVRVGRQVRFIVNPAAAKASGVQISSKLIDLAVQVR